MGLFQTWLTHPNNTQSERGWFQKEGGRKTHCLSQHRIIKILPGASLWIYLSVCYSLIPFKVWLSLNW